MILFVKQLQAAASSIDVPQLPYGLNRLIVTGKLRGAAAASSVEARIQLNGDSGANYYHSGLYSAGGTVAASNETAKAQGVLGYAPAANGTADAWLSFVAEFPDYGRQVGWQQALIQSGSWPGNDQVLWHVWLTRQVAEPLATLSIFPDSGDWAAGSLVQVWGG